MRAGYSPHSNSIYLWPKKPAFMARVEKFRARREPARAIDLTPIIERLLAIADHAATSNEAAAMRAAPEDLDTESEDHIADETRYACLSRPLAARPARPPEAEPSGWDWGRGPGDAAAETWKAW